MFVADNGPGFSDDVLSSATEGYVTTKKTGTGLGLAIVKRIVEDHHGVIEISNKKIGGAIIKLIFNTKELKVNLKQ